MLMSVTTRKKHSDETESKLSFGFREINQKCSDEQTERCSFLRTTAHTADEGNTRRNEQSSEIDRKKKAEDLNNSAY